MMLGRVVRAGVALLLGFFLSAAGHAHAADSVDAKSAYERARHYSGVTGAALDLDQALRYTRIAAEAGHVQAQVDLGFLYYDGDARVPKDLAASLTGFRRRRRTARSRPLACSATSIAMVWAARSAIRSKPSAGTGALPIPATVVRRARNTSYYASYEAGRGVRKDLRAATGWLVKASESGNPRAQRTLGLAYQAGYGVPRDPALAKLWILKSREGVSQHEDHEHHVSHAKRGHADHAGEASPR